MQSIPLSQIPAQSLTTNLDGQECTLLLRWRQVRLYLDLSVGTRTICQGAICQNRADIVQSRSPYFKGTLHFFDTEGDQPPHWQGLDGNRPGRWVLIYVPEGEETPNLLR